MAGDAMSDFLSEKLLNYVIRNVTYTAPGTSLAIALFTGTAGLNTGYGTTPDWSSEVNQTAPSSNYARLNFNTEGVTFAAASGSPMQVVNDQDIVWPVASGANWGLITAVAVMDSTTLGAGGGNVLFWGTLANSKQVNISDQFKILAGDLIIQLT